MNKYTFSAQSGKAYYCNSIPGFIKDTSESIIGHLVKRAFEVNKAQSDAWENQIQELQKRLEESQVEGDIIFEYDIVRLGKRIDVILLIKHMVFALEFKNGKNVFTAQDAQQAEDYALDIKNFHKESEDLYVCPRGKEALEKIRNSININRVHPEAYSMAVDLIKRYFQK